MIEKHEGCSWDVDNVLIFDLDAGYTNVFDLQKKKKIKHILLWIFFNT